MGRDRGSFAAGGSAVKCRSALTIDATKSSFDGSIGGYSSMVEPQIVVLDVAGSSPVGHPIFH
jgi:hypothetical protein